MPHSQDKYIPIATAADCLAVEHVKRELHVASCTCTHFGESSAVADDSIRLGPMV